jgi:DNA polymerase III psi subunit
MPHAKQHLLPSCRLVNVQRNVLGPSNPVLLTTLTSLAMVCHQVMALGAYNPLSVCVRAAQMNVNVNDCATWWLGMHDACVYCCLGSKACIWMFNEYVGG